MTIYLIDYVLPSIIQDLFEANTRTIMIGDTLTKDDFEIENYSKKYGGPIFNICDELYIPSRNLRISSFNNMSYIVNDAANRIIYQLFHSENAIYSIFLHYCDSKNCYNLKLRETQNVVIASDIGMEDVLPFYRILLLENKRRIYKITDDKKIQFDPYYRIKEKFIQEVFKK